MGNDGTSKETPGKLTPFLFFIFPPTNVLHSNVLSDTCSITSRETLPSLIRILAPGKTILNIMKDELRHHGKAKEYFSQIIDLAGKNDPYINYHYALFLEEEGNLAKAKELIENAYSLYENADKEMKLAQDIWKKYAEYQTVQ